jgi:hypothetical protein
MKSLFCLISEVRLFDFPFLKSDTYSETINPKSKRSDQKPRCEHPIKLAKPPSLMVISPSFEYKMMVIN